MTLTNTFFIIAIGISAFFVISFVVLFVCYLTIYNRVNRNFKAVDYD